MSAVNFILSLARKILAKQSKGITTIPTQMAAESKAGEIAAILQDAGLPLNRADEFIKSEQDLVRILNMIENTPPIMKEVPSGIRSTQSAKVFDLQGKEIKNPKNIMGGKEVKETETQIKTKLEKGNKEGIARIRKRQKMLDDAIDDASPGFSGDRKVDAELVAENLAERMGMVYDDLPTKERLKIYDEAFQGLTKKKFNPQDMAQGGRAGFDNGGLLSMLDIKAQGSKSGKQQIPRAPKGITMDSETYNIILNADIPVGEKINLLAKYGRDKGRTRIEKDDQELILGEGGSRNREIGLGFNPNAEKGFSGNIMYNPDSDNVRAGITYKFAEGGRIGYKDGPDLGRRTFLKILGGLAAVPIVGKFFKLSKVGQKVKQVPVIKTDDVAGKPEWFDALVNKVITEGDDVTKKFATGERQSIHQKTLDDGSVVRVTEDVDQGAVRVEYESDANVFEDTVQMEYKKPLPDEGDPRPSAEFTTAESGPVGRQTGPDDYDIEVDEVGGSSIRDLDSDVSKLKEYATGKGPTMREIIENKKRRDKAKAITEGGDEMIDAVTRRQGDYDPFASGGIARMLGE